MVKIKILAVDFGDSRTGLAVCDRTETLSSPVGVIQERNFETVVTKISYAAQEYDVKMIVVGNPINMNGSIGPRSQKCQLLRDKLESSVGMPVVLWDERSSTVSAHNLLNDVNKRGAKRKAVIDAAAAAIILDSYLEYRKNNFNGENKKT